MTSLIRDFRAKYPNAVTFLQAECDMAARDGDLTRAIALTHEIDKLDKSSTLGVLMRARVYARRQAPRGGAKPTPMRSNASAGRNSSTSASCSARPCSRTASRTRPSVRPIWC